MASQQPPLPSWAPPGAEWTSKESDAPAAQATHGVRNLVLFVAIVVVPLLLLVSGGYVVEHYVYDRYTDKHPDSLLDLPRIPGSGEVVVMGKFRDDLGLPSTVTAYGTDPAHILVVATKVKTIWRPQREFNRIIEAAARADSRDATVQATARAAKGLDFNVAVPKDGYGGVGRCFGASKGSVCLMVNDDSVVLVVSLPEENAADAVRHAREVRKKVLQKKPYRF